MLGRWPGTAEAVEVPTPYGATRVNSCGPAGSPPVVLLPGGGATSTVWGACAAAGLAGSRRVHAVDLMGDSGFSVPEPARPLRAVADLTSWVDAVLDGLGCGPVTLVGHSYGAWIAAHWAPARAERLQRLVLLDPTRVFTGLRLPYVLRALPVLVRPTPQRMRSFLTWENGGPVPDPLWLRLQEEGADFPAARPVTGPRPDLAEPAELPHDRIDVLFAAHARCHDATRAARAARVALPGARVDIIPGTHHALPLTAAQEIARRLTV
ncbi:alpha/beta fold hydrolase [Streptomyces sp. NPDC060048]|uniref:alpha/beta fold hydrolase n=1 Tax=unclassified Streptomyces TaxID=2593676 RepID=UPI0036884BB1